METDNNKNSGLMRAAVIMRLIGNAVISVQWAKTYTDTREVLMRVHKGGTATAFIIAVLLLDTALTLLWQKYPKTFYAHLALHIQLGAIFYTVMQFDALNYGGGIGTIMLLGISIVMTMIGTVPFAVFNSARKKLNSAAEKASHDER